MQSMKSRQPSALAAARETTPASLERPDRPAAERDRVVLACEDNLAFMEKLHDGQMKLVITSPPYNLGKDYEAKTSLDDYLEAQERVISECVRVLHPQGSICWQVGNYVNDGEIVPLDAVLYPVFRKHGLKLRNRIVWHFQVDPKIRTGG